jgi:heterodisulfide reductase subunit A-like polyferredoxin/coenzyme F420-reducing hydrogenase delta subunit
VAGKRTTNGNVGVILCDCRGDLKKSLNWTSIRTGLGAVEDVASVAVCGGLCEEGECAKAAATMLKGGVKRLVLAGCGADTLSAALGDVVGAGRLDSGLWWSVDLRGSGRGAGDKDAATKSALDRVTSAVSRVRQARPVKPVRTAVSRGVVVFGAGIAGMQSALALANLGHKVSVIWNGKELGGMTAALPELFGHLAPDADESVDAVRAAVARLVRDVSSHANVRLFPETNVKSVSGEPGNYTVSLAAGNGGESLVAGALVLATGGASQPKTPAPATVVDLPGLVNAVRSGKPPRRIAVVMDAAGEQSSTVTFEVLSIAERLARIAGTKVTVFCKHVRVAATGIEALYRRARAAGVMVVRNTLPVGTKASDTDVRVSYRDAVTGQPVEETFDIVAMADNRPAKELSGVAATISQLRGGPDGAIQYDNAWLLPVQTNLPGVFVVGGGRGNSEYRQALTDGLAAATQVHGFLGDGWIRGYEDAASVDADKCVLCLTCRRICPHGAIEVDEKLKAARVSVVACRRCGTCAAECPARAILLPRYTDAEVDAEACGSRGVTVFACENSAIPAAEAGAGPMAADVRVIRVPCAGKVDPRMVLGALQNGASKVVVMGCHPENCRYLTGSSRAARRMARLGAMLEKAGIDRSRVEFKGIASVEPRRFTESIGLGAQA